MTHQNLWHRVKHQTMTLTLTWKYLSHRRSSISYLLSKFAKQKVTVPCLPPPPAHDARAITMQGGGVLPGWLSFRPRLLLELAGCLVLSEWLLVLPITI